VYGSTAGTEFTAAGLQNGQTMGSVTLTSTGALATAGVGSSPYAITASAASGGSFAASDYTIGYFNGSMTITPATLTAGLTGKLAKVYDAIPPVGLAVGITR
jgi:hypothetical protein